MIQRLEPPGRKSSGESFEARACRPPSRLFRNNLLRDCVAANRGMTCACDEVRNDPGTVPRKDDVHQPQADNSLGVGEGAIRWTSLCDAGPWHVG
jgi:hypothetical protein